MLDLYNKNGILIGHVGGIDSMKDLENKIANIHMEEFIKNMNPVYERGFGKTPLLSLNQNDKNGHKNSK